MLFASLTLKYSGIWFRKHLFANLTYPWILLTWIPICRTMWSATVSLVCRHRNIVFEQGFLVSRLYRCLIKAIQGFPIFYIYKCIFFLTGLPYSSLFITELILLFISSCLKLDRASLSFYSGPQLSKYYTSYPLTRA